MKVIFVLEYIFYSFCFKTVIFSIAAAYTYERNRQDNYNLIRIYAVTKLYSIFFSVFLFLADSGFVGCNERKNERGGKRFFYKCSGILHDESCIVKLSTQISTHSHNEI